MRTTAAPCVHLLVALSVVGCGRIGFEDMLSGLSPDDLDGGCVRGGCISSDDCSSGMVCVDRVCCSVGTEDAGRETCATEPCDGGTAVDLDAFVPAGCGGGCPDGSTSEWGDCVPDSPCAESGTQSRTRTTYTCESDACVASETPETQPCARFTDGDSCGTPMSSAWTECLGFANVCDSTGQRYRMHTTMACDGGTCRAETATESEECTRDTEGVYCAVSTRCECIGEQCLDYQDRTPCPYAP